MKKQIVKMVKRKESVLNKICKLIEELKNDAKIPCLFVWKGPLQDHVVGSQGIKTKVIFLD